MRVKVARRSTVWILNTPPIWYRPVRSGNRTAGTNEVGGRLGNGQDGGLRIAGHSSRHDRCIDDTQAGNAYHAQSRIDDGARIPAEAARTDGMKRSVRLLANVRERAAGARHDLSTDADSAACRSRGDRAREVHATPQHVSVCRRREVPGVDLWRLHRVGRNEGPRRGKTSYFSTRITPETRTLLEAESRLSGAIIVHDYRAPFAAWIAWENGATYSPQTDQGTAPSHNDA
jgi:hypothetical protein